ncbi:hypothetical protein VPNG_04863 [Cytospora leucostoma]|uniref:Uncharacterized protein n=1 Tax=Cytospora leucostoma TaxID=1230097 RepID=A0A423XB84_9PEZI|nr:hypothetical protein VPNG_04863 [Cytospora leucostoma]
MAPSNPARRKHRRMARDNPNLSDDKKDERRNTSSEDEGGAANDNTNTELITANHEANSLIDSATQHAGLPRANGAALAVAALQQNNHEDAFRLLAAATAKANLELGRISNNASQAVVMALDSNEGVRNSDATYDNRYKRQEEINTQLEEHSNALQLRIARLEGMLGRILTLLLNNNVDAAQIAEMLRELSI